MSLPDIEDEFEDVLGKAMRGQSLSLAALASRADVSLEAIRDLVSGQWEERAACRVAEALNLNADCLCRLAGGAAAPKVALPDGVHLHNTPFPLSGYEAMTVNSYSLVPPEQSDEGALIDAGASFQSIKEKRGEAMAAQWKLFLTHTHADHVANYDELSGIASRRFTPAGEPFQGALPAREGDLFEIGPWRLRAIETPGHSPDGTSYLLEGASSPVAFVGDAVFCYSMGKVGEGYATALALLREKILGLPDETILCPGHGPPTTVGFEKTHNPFFA